jgi:sugar/nucleoside kinase (ribokinase family)
MAKPRAIVCVGRLYADLIMTGLPRLPRLGREEYADGMLVTPGGGAFITAAYLAAFGRPVRLAACLGNDPISAGLAPQIEKTGLSLDLIERFDDGPQLTVALALDGDRAFATHRAGPAAPKTVEAALAAADVVHLHIAELATLREAPWLLDLAEARGLGVSLDIAWDSEALADPASLDLLARTQLVLPNTQEAAALTGLPENDVERLLATLTALGPSVCLKRGNDGAAFSDGRAIWHAAALPVPVVDATGAGDAFAAGFLDSWLDGVDPAAGLARAIAAGTFAVGRVGGATELPSRAALDHVATSVAITRPVRATARAGE